MINIHTDILPEVNHNEMWFLLHIVKRMNRQMTCFPSINTLQKDTSFSRAKIFDIIKSLKAKGIISIQQRLKKNGAKSSNVYKLHTSLMGVYITTKNAEFELTEDGKEVVQKLDGGVVQKLN